ncbi:MAG: bifunctional phosphopantothenoylcysteine decarboxylase/phosphopantothenate--cysteine ligase CoaBC [Bacteroidales bacterium]|nr:bifunctional phosphopantothenoylcysteine decarboxylase/phosphopantothenate--cysteine ligase CoaBC [Bacteroidales bacterium]
MDTSRGHILIGITGGIAAYKTMTLIRLFKKNGYEVKVVATRHAMEFVTKTTVETLSQNPLYVDLFDHDEPYDVQHIALVDWADAMVVAPATANIIGKYAHGIADDLLSTILLACSKPVFIAPAMNDNMYAEPSVQLNITLLREKGCLIISPNDGFLACGTSGKGRMEEPEEIYEDVVQYLQGPKCLSGKKVMITAGPTYEPIDPVRFVGNRSSGLMGFALAEAAADMGAEVTLITGPTHLQTQNAHIHRVDVETAGEMYQQCMLVQENQDVMIMAAAVADYTPAAPAPEKIKKTDDELQLQLTKTKDILASIGKVKRDDQILVGFALETEHERENALKKLHNKNADMIVLNSLRDKGAGFGTPTNKVCMITKDEQTFESELKSKADIARDILNVVCNLTKQQ